LIERFGSLGRGQSPASSVNSSFAEQKCVNT